MNECLIILYTLNNHILIINICEGGRCFMYFFPQSVVSVQEDATDYSLQTDNPQRLIIGVHELLALSFMSLLHEFLLEF